MVNSPFVFSETSSVGSFSTCSVKGRDAYPRRKALHSVAAACEAKQKQAQTAAPFKVDYFIVISPLRNCLVGPLGRNTTCQGAGCQTPKTGRSRWLQEPSARIQAFGKHALCVMAHRFDRQSAKFARGFLHREPVKFLADLVRNSGKIFYRQSACLHMLISFFSLRR